MELLNKKFIFIWQLTILLILTSCQKYIDLEKNENLWVVKNATTKIERIYHIPWKVGRTEKKEISQGFVIEMHVPAVSKDNASDLIYKHKIDSWIFKIEKVKGDLPRIFGYTNVPFQNINKSTSTTSIKIYYAAAAASGRFRSFSCPAFKHRKLIRELDLQYNSSKTNDLRIKFDQVIKGRVEMTKFFPISFNGGLNLEGEYQISMALYSTKEKKTYGKFIPLSGSIRVLREEEIMVASCSGVREEDNPESETSSGLSLKNFQIPAKKND